MSSNQKAAWMIILVAREKGICKLCTLKDKMDKCENNADLPQKQETYRVIKRTS